VGPKLLIWIEETPDQTGKMLVHGLQGEHPGLLDDGQLRTLQRPMRQWRLHRTRKMVFGVHNRAVVARLDFVSHALICDRSTADASQIIEQPQTTG
jgi:hypothetical protein